MWAVNGKLVIPLEWLYSANHYCNNLLTVLLDNINLFSEKSEYLLSSYLFTKGQHNAGVIIPCIILKIIQA